MARRLSWSVCVHLLHAGWQTSVIMDSFLTTQSNDPAKVTVSFSLLF